MGFLGVVFSFRHAQRVRPGHIVAQGVRGEFVGYVNSIHAREISVTDDEPLAKVTLPSMPDHYQHRLKNGKSVAEIAPTIEWGYLIYLTVLCICQYFGESVVLLCDHRG